ncbi:MAG: hypothetical protein QOD69_1376 [Solirubrobacteraceae bacterium]|nr:hypothetical protein [Solirubrobacteraceae bacterium]
MRVPPDPRRPPPIRARRLRRATGGLALLASVVATTPSAWAYWSASATAGSHGAAVAATVSQGATPTAIAAAGRTVAVAWGASTLSNGHPVDGYVVKRYDAATGSRETTLAGCANTVRTTSCIESGVPSGQWKYTVTPVFAAHWEGREGLESGVTSVAAAAISLDEAVFGAPPRQDATGSLAGFAATEGVSYELDATTSLAGTATIGPLAIPSTPLTGSPASVGSAGSAAISRLTIPSTSDGAHTVYALGDGETTSPASTSIVVDTTAPSVSAQPTPAPTGAGWHTSGPVLVGLSAADGTGSGIDRIRYTTDLTDPRSSASASDYESALAIGSDTAVRYSATDLAGNTSAVGIQLVPFDATAPVNGLELSDVRGGAYLAGTTVYYRGSGPGSFTLTNAETDAGGSGVLSSATSELAGSATGWSHAAAAVTTPARGPFVSAPFQWSAGTASTPDETVTAADAAANTTPTALTFTPDTTGPATGALTVNAAAGTAAGSVSTSTTGSFAISRTDYADDGSGLATSVLTRATATLRSPGTCGSYGSASVIAGAPAQRVSGGACYRYTLTGIDEVGNASAISAAVMVATAPPGAPPTSSSPATGGTCISANPALVDPPAAATTDDTSAPSTTTYSWPGAGAAPSVTATETVADIATGASTAATDTMAPCAGALAVNGSATASTSTTGSFAISRTDYADAGSGLRSSVLAVERAPLHAPGAIAAGTCGSYATAEVIVGAPAQSVSGPACYRYTLTGTDQAGNAAATTSIVKVGTTALGVPSISDLPAATGATEIFGSTISDTTVADTAPDTLTVTPDTTAPTTGALAVNGSATASTSTTGSFAISRTDYTDGGSGLLSSVLTVERAPLSTSGEVGAGTCGSFGSASVIAGAPAQSVSGPACYRYTLTGTDQAGNAAATTSMAKVDTTVRETAAPAPAPAPPAATGATTDAPASAETPDAPDAAGPTVTALVSQQSGGGAGNGQLEVGDQLVLTFSEELAPATVPSTFSGTETRAASPLSFQPQVLLTIPSFTIGALGTGASSYLANDLLCAETDCSAGTATFSGNAALVENGASTTVTLTVIAVGGDATGLGIGALPFQPAASIRDRAANPATGTFSTAGAFRLF